MSRTGDAPLVQSDQPDGRRARQRILILSDDFKPNPGGIAEMLECLALEWSKQGVEVQVLTPWHGICEEDEPFLRLRYFSDRDRLDRGRFPRATLPIWRARRFLLGKSNAPVFRYWRRRYYQAMLSQVRPQMIFVGAWSPYTSQVLRDAGALDVPVYCIAHGAEVLLYARTHAERFKEDFSRYSAIICNSSFTRATIERLGIPHRDLFVTRMGVRDIRNLAPPEIPRERAIAELARNHRVILTLGTLNPRKGVDRTLESIASVQAKLPGDFLYVVAGDGPYRARLQSQAIAMGIAHLVHFAGRVSDRLKAELLRSCEVLVMPSRMEQGWNVEGFGIVYLEAGLFGKPVIAGNAGGAPEAVQNEHTGILVDPNSPAQIAAAILRMLNSPDERGRLGAQASANAVSLHRWDRIASELLANCRAR